MAILLWAATVHGTESVATAWVQRFNGYADSQDHAEVMAADSTGNVIVGGYTDSGFAGGDWLIIKYSNAGTPLWTNRYNGPDNNNDRVRALKVDGNGSVFVMGYSGHGDDTYDYLTIKYSGAGLPLWTNRYAVSTNGHDEASAIAVDGSGHLIVTGYSDGDYVTTAYSSAGFTLWTNHYDGPNHGPDYPTALAVDGNGNVFVTGESYGGTNTYYDFVTVAYSVAGVPMWTNRYDGTNVIVLFDEDGEPVGDDDDYAKAIAVDGNGNVFVTGNSAGNYATVAYSGAGVPLWTNRYIGPGAAGSTGQSYDIPLAIAADSSGNVFVTGYSQGDGNNGDDYATIKYSGVGVPLWTNRYNGPPLPNYSGSDLAIALAVDGNGNAIVTGRSSGISGDVDSDYVTIKYSGAGVPLWTRRYNGTGNGIDDVEAIAVDNNGNVFVTGSSISSGGSYDCATLKYSSDGTQLWVNRYDGGPGNSYDQAVAVAVDGSGNAFVTGSSGGYGYGAGHYATIKYSSVGVPLWTNFYNGSASSFDLPAALGLDGNGNVVVTGTSRNNTNSVSDYVTIKYSNAGMPLWTNRYNGQGNGYDQANAVAVDSNGNVIVAGRSTVNPAPGYNYATIKYSGAGVPLWTNRFAGGGKTDEPKAVAVDIAGNVFVTGSSYPASGPPSYATVAYSSAGAPLWTNRYFAPYIGPGSFGGIASAIAVDATGNVFVTGGASFDEYNSDYVTIKYSGAGARLWMNRYNAPQNSVDFANALAVDGSGNVVVTGSSSSADHYFDYATIKYSGAGVALWTNRYTSPGYRQDDAYSVAVDSSGNVFVTGRASIGNDTYGYDYATIKYSGTGVPLWTNSYNGPAGGSDLPETKQSLALGPSGSVYVTGRSDGNAVRGSLLYDFATIKYVTLPTLGIRRSGPDTILSWPSPFSDFVLQQNTTGFPTTSWSNVTGNVQDDGTDRVLQITASPGNRFYRLYKP